MKTNKCEICNKRYRKRDFHEGIEEHICFSCKVFSRVLAKRYGSMKNAFYKLGVYDPKSHEYE